MKDFTLGLALKQRWNTTRNRLFCFARTAWNLWVNSCVLCYENCTVFACELNPFGQPELKANFRLHSVRGREIQDWACLTRIRLLQLFLIYNVPVISQQTWQNFLAELKLHQLGESVFLTCHWKPWSDKQKERKLRTSASLVFEQAEYHCYSNSALCVGLIYSPHSKPTLDHNLHLRPKTHSTILK